MSISSINGNVGSFSPSQSSSQLSSTDSKKLQEILSNYDAENMDESSLAELKSELKSANFTPTKALGDAIKSAGFDPGQLRPEDESGTQQTGAPKGKGGNRPPPPPKSGESEGTSSAISGNSLNVDLLQPLSEILQNFDLNNLSEDDQQSIIEQLQAKGILQSGLMINLSA